ncbi:MAG TPA: phenylacetate--CoA ligase family protein [Acidobacteria bacterium]|nr:phenylacetate--CoA ligase family protein [Acidobacteriota bacterium]
MMEGVRELVALGRRQWWSRSRLEGFQLERLRRLLRHAAANVPFYRELYGKAGIDVEEVRTLEDLRRLPVVRREDLQARPQEELIADGVDPARVIRTRTSGSTGVPLEILSRRRDRSVFNPSFFRSYLAWGLRPWHRMTYFQARPEKLVERSWYEPLGIFRRQMLSSLDPPERSLEAIASWRPHLIHGYSLTLKLLAEAAVRRGVQVPVPLVASTSGVLDEVGRDLIRRAFGARILDIYASEEAGSVMAWQCPRCEGHHLCLDTVVVEIVRDGRPVGPGEEGAVLVTNLSNFTMPLIRYEQGDIVRRSSREPVCGRGLPLIESVQGRAGDYVVLTSGRRLTPHPFFLVLDHALGVGRWQVVQESLERIVVRVTASATGEPPDRGFIVEGIRRLVGPGVAIEVEVVERLRDDPSRKLRSVVSRLPESAIGRE